MSKTVILAEKPSVARDIGRVLNCNKKGNGYLEGNKYIVTWALGHLVTLAAPEKYNEKYKTWNMEDLPMLPEPMKLEVIKRSSKQFYTVKTQMNRKDVNQIIIGTDAGREGELVARWIIEKANIKKPIKRLWISSVTDKAIKDGFSNLKDGKKYESLYESAQARSEADWIVGINATRALTVKFNAQLSCGRVQTPTLTMINEREKEIKKFVPREYYEISAVTKDLKFAWEDENQKDTRTFNKSKSDKIVKNLKGKDIEVIDINKVKKKSYSPGLYDLTELQRDANRIFNFSAKETLSIMQRLYERHKILTYPRTDSRFISEDLVPTLKDRVKACSVAAYGRIGNKILRSPIKSNKSFVNNDKVTDHHGIIPTEERVLLSELNDGESKIYDLVIKRFLAVLSPAEEYEQIIVKAKIDDENFVAKGRRVISKGWKEVFAAGYENSMEDNIDEQKLPILNRGDILKVRSLSQIKGKTKAPALLNEGTLLSAMENPSKYMSGESKKLKKIIGKTGGIGTVATRADVIEKLFNSLLIERQGRGISITSKGKQLLDIVPEELKSPALTAEWEQKLGLIAKGELRKEKFVKEMREYSKSLVKEIKNSDATFKHDNLTRNKCPDCGKFMLEIKNKRGKMNVCQDRECGHKKNVYEMTNARCPRCKKRLKLRGEGDEKTFTCSCGHREKLSAFNKRKSKQKSRMSKKEVNKYLNKQEKVEDEGLNTGLADALSKIKL